MRRDKKGRVSPSINQKEMQMISGWVKEGVTDRKQLALQIMMHFPIKSQITAEKYARIALNEQIEG